MHTRAAVTLLAALAGAAALPGPAAAQRTLDRIVAIVGARPILASEIDERVAEFQARGGQLPADSAGREAVRRGILEQLVEEELLVYHAQRDTAVRVSEQEVVDQVEKTYQNVRGQFATEAEFVAQLQQARFGSVEEWRRWLTETQRRTLMAQRLIELQRQAGKLRPIPPSEAQMRAFWEERRGDQPRRPATASFRQIVIVARADSVARARSQALADSLVGELRRGADFAAAARRFSGDSASREQGGELGWFRRGVMVPEFEDVAFRIRPGEISAPVESPFGLHIIKVDRAQPAEVFARHILIVPDVVPAQVTLARRLADSVHTVLRAGASFDTLARRYGDPSEPKLAEGAPITQLPAEYQALLAADSTVGLKPVVTVGGGPRPKFVVLEITARHAEGELSYEDVKLQIRTQLAEQLSIQHYIDQLRKQTFVDIRM